MWNSSYDFYNGRNSVTGGHLATWRGKDITSRKVSVASSSHEMTVSVYSSDLDGSSADFDAVATASINNCRGSSRLFLWQCAQGARSPPPPSSPPYICCPAVFADLNLDVRAGSIGTACICMLAACVAVAAMACFEKLGSPAVASAVAFFSFLLGLSVIITLAFTIGWVNEASGGFPTKDPTAACQHPVIATYFGADFGGVAAEFTIWTRATYMISLVWCVVSFPFLVRIMMVMQMKERSVPAEVSLVGRDADGRVLVAGDRVKGKYKGHGTKYFVGKVSLVRVADGAVLLDLLYDDGVKEEGALAANVWRIGGSLADEERT